MDLTVVPRGPAAGGGPARLAEALPLASMPDAELSLELERVQQLKAALAAYEAALVVTLAGQRPEADDPRSGEPGHSASSSSPVPGASEFFVEELAVVCNTSSVAADRLAGDSWILVERLPCVWAAMADETLDRPRGQVFVDVLGPTADGVAEQVAPRVLPSAPGLSLRRLRAALTREVLAVDADASEVRRAEAERAAQVRLYPTGDGMAEFSTELPAPLAAACWSTVDQLAQMAKADGDPRPIGQLRAGVVADLILRPWDTTRPPVTAHLTVVSPLASLGPGAGPPGEVAGQPITAAHVRELLVQLDALCPGGLQAPAGGSLEVAVTDGSGALLATAGRGELARIARQSCGEHPEAAGGTAGCGCPVLGPPPAVDGYTPNAAQRRFQRQRDRGCRHPGCGQPVGRTDLDHVTAYGDGGPTDCSNLCCLCRRHHRLKTFVRGWRFVLTEHGVLRVTTPGGITRTTRPPGLRDLTGQPARPAPPPPPAGPDEPPPF